MKPVVLSLASLSIFCTATLAMSVVADSRDTAQNHTNTTQPVLVEHTATHYTHQVEFIQTRNMAATRRIAIQEAVRLAKDERSLAVQLAKAQATPAEETVDEAKPIVKIEDVPKRVPAANTAPEPTVPKRVQSVSVTPKQTTSLPVTQPPVTAVATLIEKTVEPIVIADAYTTVLIKEIHRLTNVERKKAGVATLAFSEPLSSLSTTHSEDMATRNYFSHDSPEGCNAGCRLQEANYALLAWGENIAWRDSVSVTSAEDLAAHLVHAWMNSPDHRRNLFY